MTATAELPSAGTPLLRIRAVTNPAESRRTRPAADLLTGAVSAVAAGRIGNYRHSTKKFGPVQALAGVDLDIPARQVTALVGDNGAGKSVLIKCVAGIHVPDAGSSAGKGTRCGSARHGTPPCSASRPCTRTSRSATTGDRESRVFDVADRIAVLYLGRMAGVFATGELTKETVVDLMTAGRSDRWSVPTRTKGVAS